MTDLDSILLKTAELAALLDLTPRRVRQLAREGTFRRGTGRKFPLQACVQAYLKVKAMPEAAEWITRKVKAEALLKEHELVKLKALFADPMGLWPQWLKVYSAHVQRVVAMVLNTMPPRLTGLTNPYHAQHVLRDHLFPELRETAAELEERTAEPYRSRFREAREAEAARLAEIDAAAEARKAKHEAFERAMAKRGNGEARGDA